MLKILPIIPSRTSQNFKALPQVCMEYTVQSECRVANIAQAKMSAIFVTRHSLSS